jgi:hypothetical protein
MPAGPASSERAMTCRSRVIKTRTTSSACDDDSSPRRMLSISAVRAASRKLLQNVIFLFVNRWNWLEVFFEIRRMTPSLVSGHLDQCCQVNIFELLPRFTMHSTDPGGLTRGLSGLTSRTDSMVTRPAD